MAVKMKPVEAWAVVDRYDGGGMRRFERRVAAQRRAHCERHGLNYDATTGGDHGE